MRLEKFAEEVLRGVEEKAGETLKARIVPGNKNNGATLTGITASRPGSSGGACIYLDSYCEDYCDNRITLDEVTEDVYGKLMEHCNDLDGVDMRALWDWEAAKPHIRAKLVNREMNRELLKKVPHRDFLDLAVIYYVTLDGLLESGTAAFTVSDGNMEVWKKEEGELYQMAVSNMRLDGKPVFEDMEGILRGMIPVGVCPFAGKALKVRMYVLTNRGKIFGAAELLDENTLRGIGDKLGSDFAVLPSSVHESIIIPADVSAAYQELAEMVTDINRNVVSVEERLSDHVYLYERKEGVLRIVA